MSVPQACSFLAANEAMPFADKKAFLLSKGVSEFVIAQAECAAPADNVQGHPELPGASSDAMSVPQACSFMAANEAMPFADKKAFLLSKGVSEFVIAQAECAAPADNVQGHPELPEGVVVPSEGAAVAA